MRALVLSSILVIGCGSSPSVDAGSPDASSLRRDAGHDRDASLDAGPIASPDAASPDAGPPDAGPPPEPCTTRITYGSTWIHGGDHPAQYDEVAGRVTWDGACVDDPPNSYAILSNGWRPYFEGLGACVIAIDARGECAEPPPARCTTRITYGASWLHAPAHSAQYDDVAGAVSWDGSCHGSGETYATLSNGWQPHFAGGCSMSFRYEQCGGLYTNPVVPRSCADPGVARDGDRYVMSCTSGDAANAFPIRTSRDLVTWTNAGWIFPAGSRPSWASGDFWAPEIHRVGAQWVAYFSARDRADGSLAVGAATAPDALGPYTDIGHPLVHDPSPGVIDAHEYDAPDGRHYLLWKIDGNAIGAHTPIRIQELAPDGVTLLGAPTELIRNDQSWEGAVVEGPWMIDHGGYYYLFYSANGYASTRYGIGVARASSPLGPFTKAPAPILTSNAWWSGPGHGSVIEGPSGDTVHVYHAWVAGHVGAAPGREVLVDRVRWIDGWPTMLAAPGARSEPLP